MADETTPAAPAKKRGGARKGAGRPVKAHATAAPDAGSLDFLAQVYRSSSVPMPLRIRAAIAHAGFTNAKPAATPKLGKKEQRLLDAEQQVAAGGSFAPGRPPLVVVRQNGAGGA